eukprot:CAMPEP_0179181726 /NCGR_PEP_ID=MMETSP0796-20121207/90015_1 /TAXON_ID=73915 /ORGANISM="Pyrodinium bahamense, Strain pbaha01" /LENGTH=67 /DNA_ID=CAMNT_0020885519 /DNA_START=336 /DNA_END=536 /DNA_ORIENTATION=+
MSRPQILVASQGSPLTQVRVWSSTGPAMKMTLISSGTAPLHPPAHQQSVYRPIFALTTRFEALSPHR